MNTIQLYFLSTVISGSFRVGAVVVLAGAALLFLAALGKKCRPNPPRALNRLEKLLYAMILLGTVGLAITGLGSVIIKGEHIEGWALMLHVALGPLFAIGLAGFALSAADRFAGSGGAACCSRDQAAAPGQCCSEAASHGCPLSTVFFWLALVAGAVLLLSAAVPMLPLFGTDGQHVLLKTHRYSSLAFVALLLPHTARLFRGL